MRYKLLRFSEIDLSTSLSIVSHFIALLKSRLDYIFVKVRLFLLGLTTSD